MTTRTSNGFKVTAYLVENPNFIQKGEYKRTSVDDYKETVDFLITGVGKRYEIIFNSPTFLKTNKSIESIGSGIYEDRAYLVTEKALESLKAKYTWATDF